MPKVTREALREWDQTYRDDSEELSGMLEEKPPVFQFLGNDLHPTVVTPAEPMWYEDFIFWTEEDVYRT